MRTVWNWSTHYTLYETCDVKIKKKGFKQILGKTVLSNNDCVQYKVDLLIYVIRNIWLQEGRFQDNIRQGSPW